MSAHLIAVVPTRILRKWDVLAAAQLFDVAPRVAAELERERRLRFCAEDQAFMWEQISEVRAHGDEVGLTLDGQIVAMLPQASVS